MSEIATRTRRRVNYNALAQDLVLFGNEDLSGVMRVHGLDEVDMEDLLANSQVLRRRINQLRTQVEKDPTAILRMKASSVVEGSIVEMSALIQSHEVEPKDKISAVRLMAELANALPKNEKGAANSGVVLNLNLGDLPTIAQGMNIPRPTNVIEHE